MILIQNQNLINKKYIEMLELLLILLLLIKIEFQ